LVVPLICVSLLILALALYRANPLTAAAYQLVQAARVNVMPSIRVLERDGDRLFVVEPEKTIIYNTAGALFYYFEGGVSGRLCPYNEFAVVRITGKEIALINETGSFYITCSTVGSWSMYNHFNGNAFEMEVAMKSTRFTLLDVLNYLIDSGLAQVTLDKPAR